MENKKLIKSIKKKAIKKFKNNLKNSVLKELYDGISKKEIKELKKQILKEVQENLFGGIITSDIESSELENNIITPEEQIQNNDEILVKDSDGKVADSTEKKEDEMYEYHGFKFNKDRMSALVTGKARGLNTTIKDNGVERGENKFKRRTIVESPFPMYTQSWLDSASNSESNLDERKQIINDIREGKNKDFIKKSIEKPAPQSGGYQIPVNIPRNFKPYHVPFTRNFVSYDEKISPTSKEDLTFFLDKLKTGISKLVKGQKNINYRHSKDDIYNFSYNKFENEPEGFTLSFDIDLNIKTMKATIKDFRFNIDGFRFDSSFFEIIDIVRVLDMVGMNISKYVNEISEFNSSETPATISIKDARKNINLDEKIESIIKDPRVVSILHKNEILSYGDLLKFNGNYTSIKGIGKKTAQKIKHYIKK
ncbi:MAG: hypothetical protein AABY15_04130 [Nanoarchaeota archaeon]